MTLEEILKSLKKGDVKVYEYEKAPEGYSNTIIVVLTENGEYQFRLKTKYDYFIPHSHNIEDLLEQIKEYDVFDWTEIDYEVFIPREKLKEKTTQLKEALERACSYICCDYCPLYSDELESCSKAFSERFCADELSDYFLNEVK